VIHSGVRSTLITLTFTSQTVNHVARHSVFLMASSFFDSLNPLSPMAVLFLNELVNHTWFDEKIWFYGEVRIEVPVTKVS
jgi:hypothetical protein